jgi:ATP-binding cassette subfamily F protein uup
MRLLMGEPNVLLLDEPTNDLDVDTLTALEDLLDGWPGTLVVVSHDRYFVERVCDNVHALTAAGGIRHLAGGIDQYIEQRRTVEESQLTRSSQARSIPAGARIRAARKETQRAERELTRLEGAIELLTQRETTLNEQMAVAATDHARLTKLQAELGLLVTERGALETSWLEASESLERCE